MKRQGGAEPPSAEPPSVSTCGTLQNVNSAPPPPLPRARSPFHPPPLLFPGGGNGRRRFRLKGKNVRDKRENIKDRDAKRDTQRITKKLILRKMCRDDCNDVLPIKLEGGKARGGEGPMHYDVVVPPSIAHLAQTDHLQTILKS